MSEQSQVALGAPDEVYIPTGTDRRFRVGPCSTEDGVTRAVMATGQWMQPPELRSAAGALAALVDDVLGFAVLVSRPEGWATFVQLTLDVVGHVPTDGSRLLGEAWPVEMSNHEALARGRVVDLNGRVVALFPSAFGMWGATSCLTAPRSNPVMRTCHGPRTSTSSELTSNAERTRPT